MVSHLKKIKLQLIQISRNQRPCCEKRPYGLGFTNEQIESEEWRFKDGDGGDEVERKEEKVSASLFFKTKGLEIWDYLEKKKDFTGFYKNKYTCLTNYKNLVCLL